MKIEIKKSSLDNLGTDAVVVFASKAKSMKKKNDKKGESKKNGESKATALVEGVGKAVQAKVQAAVDQGVISGGVNETMFFRDAGVAGAQHLVVVGVGSAENFSHEILRQAVASAHGVLKSNKVKSVAIGLDSLPHNSIGADVTTQAVAEGLLLASYSFDDLKEKKGNTALERASIVTASKAASYERGLDRGMILSECVNFARWLGVNPGNRMTPTILADETVRAAKGTKLKVNVWGKDKIKAEKMGSFLSVALGSAQEPKFIAMEYYGAAGSKKPVCFVGKGLTFDSGGISIKPGAGMEEMKYDMCGGAAVIGTMLALAKMKAKVNAIAFVPATENMPGPAANKPGDIVVARNGKTIEVNNTDAEGRLILNDALVWACEQKPAWICDAATLTGAMVVALGNIHTGVFTRNDRFAEKIREASEESGELTWRMPLVDFHVRDMKGTYADLSNISSAKGAGSATAAGFLEQFVDKDIPWAHFDVAGTAWHSGDRFPYNPKKGATGVMVRTFVQLALNSF
jgi:leucyl aminopeptidase